MEVLAIDMGSSSLRAVLGTWEDGNLQQREIFRREHEVQVDSEGAYWDVEALRSGALEACRALGHAPDAVTVDGWGVDYVLVDDAGNPVAPAWAYRDRRGEQGRKLIQLPEREQFQLSGVAVQDINSLYRLVQQSDLLGTVMFVQDWVAKQIAQADLEGWAPPVKVSPWASRAVASTSGLLTADHRQWCQTLLQVAGQPTMPPVRDERTVIAQRGKTSLVRGGSHDTACAVYALDLQAGDVFVSCGSWAVVGMVTENALLSEAAYRAGITNEATCDNRNRAQLNLPGMWISQECRRWWKDQGLDVSYSLLDQLTAAAPRSEHLIDPTLAHLAEPGEMPLKLHELTGIDPLDRGAMLRLVTDSVARRIITAIDTLREVTQMRGRVILLGGGTKDPQLVASLQAGLAEPLIVGPSEASALGAILASLHTIGVTSGETRHWAHGAALLRTANE